jgi:hypothetical protein
MSRTGRTTRTLSMGMSASKGGLIQAGAVTRMRRCVGDKPPLPGAMRRGATSAAKRRPLTWLCEGSSVCAKLHPEYLVDLERRCEHASRASSTGGAVGGWDGRPPPDSPELSASGRKVGGDEGCREIFGGVPQRKSSSIPRCWRERRRSPDHVKRLLSRRSTVAHAATLDPHSLGKGVDEELDQQ